MAPVAAHGARTGTPLALAQCWTRKTGWDEANSVMNNLPVGGRASCNEPISVPGGPSRRKRWQMFEELIGDTCAAQYQEESCND